MWFDHTGKGHRIDYICCQKECVDHHGQVRVADDLDMSTSLRQDHMAVVADVAEHSGSTFRPQRRKIDPSMLRRPELRAAFVEKLEALAAAIDDNLSTDQQAQPLAEAAHAAAEKLHQPRRRQKKRRVSEETWQAVR